MRPVARVEGRAVVLSAANIDTDQLIPARFMKEPRRPQGYGRFLLRDLRDAGLDPLAGGCAILLAGRNFGCGSSREAAVYALVDFGVGAVLAPSFGDIFAANAVNNGLVAAAVDDAGLARLADAAGRGAPLAVDLTTLTVEGAGAPVPFALDPTARTRLLNGWDEIDLTRAHAAEIAAFAAADAARRPWAGPPRNG